MAPKLIPSFVDLLFKKLDPEKFQERFLEALTKVQRVERGSIWVEKGKRYVCTAAIGEEAEKVRGLSVAASVRSVVGDVIATGKTVIAEPGEAPFFRGVEKNLARKNSLILCFPLALKNGGVYGAVQILDTTSEGSRMNLDPGYLELLEGLVAIGGVALNASLELADEQEQNRKMRRIIEEFQDSPSMVGQSEAFLEVKRTAQIYAGNDFPVMITGESGTGKEVVARDIHRLSPRKGKPFLVQNCSAIPDTLLESELFGYRKGAFTGANTDKVGLFEAADGGTLFLDEIGDMPLGLQAKMLRVLQNQEIKPLGTAVSRKIDVRIIAATNRDLEVAINQGGFREDLYYRLNVLPLRMPPIREREGDIPLLLAYFLKHFSVVSGRPPKVMDPQTVERLAGHSWPGNIREMENLVKYLLTVTQGDTIFISDLPPSYAAPSPAGRNSHRMEKKGEPERAPSVAAGVESGDLSMEGMERTYILSLLEKTKWNVTSAAQRAGLKRTTFTSRMKRLGISRKI